MKLDKTKIKELMKLTGTKPGDLVIALTVMILLMIILLTMCNVTYISRTQPVQQAVSDGVPAPQEDSQPQETAQQDSGMPAETNG